MRIVTSYVNPPIPYNSHDWCAVDDATYGGESSDPIGYGPTEIAAIRDLLDQIEMRQDDK